MFNPFKLFNTEALQPWQLAKSRNFLLFSWKVMWSSCSINLIPKLGKSTQPTFSLSKNLELCIQPAKKKENDPEPCFKKTTLDKHKHTHNKHADMQHCSPSIYIALFSKLSVILLLLVPSSGVQNQKDSYNPVRPVHSVN